MKAKSIISDLRLKFADRSWNETFQLVRRCMVRQIFPHCTVPGLPLTFIFYFHDLWLGSTPPVPYDNDGNHPKSILACFYFVFSETNPSFVYGENWAEHGFCTAGYWVDSPA